MTNYRILNDCRGMLENEIVQTIFEQRGIEDVDHFMNPTKEDLLPLDSLYRINEAYERAMSAINNNEHISILADTDLDGITSGTIVTRYLKHFTDNIQIHIDEGKQHGLIGQDLSQFEDSDLLIIVDSLDKDVSQYRKLRDMGIDIIILDHHAIKESEPYDDYVILVSSQRKYENPQLSGAGVVWKFCKYFDETNTTDFADELVDLAASGIIGDMMSMISPENRYIAKIGLSQKINPCIKKIVGSFDFNSTAVAFSLAPIINAANRIGKNNIALDAFLADDNKQVLAYVKELKKCKELQNEEVSRLLPSVIKQCEAQTDKK